VATSLPD